MRAVVQRVDRASVTVDGEVVGEIGRGLLALVGVAAGDGPSDAEALADKLVGLRIFPDQDGKMNRSVAEAGGGVLVVSQFTLLADLRKGRRPSFTGAAPPAEAASLIDQIVRRLEGAGLRVGTGRFGASMAVELVNDGPVTLVIDVESGRVV